VHPCETPLVNSSSTGRSDGDSFGLDDAYAVVTPDDSRRLYAKWAETYDSGFVTATGYEYHEHVAEVFVAAERPEGPTLDVGCGTGAVGEALRARGVDWIDGVDISAEMLARAASKDVYRDLIEADLTIGLDIVDDTYAGITSAGTFTHGHLPPAPIGELLRVAMPGAHCTIGVNAAHWVDQGFEAYLDRLAAEQRISQYVVTVVKVYAGSDPSVPNDMSNLVSFTVS